MHVFLVFEIFIMLTPLRYILIDRSAWFWVYKVLLAKWRPSQHQYKKYHRYGMVEKPSPSRHPPKNTIKKLKNEYILKKTRPPLKICECVTLTKCFFIWPKFPLEHFILDNTRQLFPEPAPFLA